ncbi:MAG: S-layer homology domain-containing protein [Oscillospiraceae bacterium]|nr:S-layer homology domain-containing protein [Oscillospiraceae bacterium]
MKRAMSFLLTLVMLLGMLPGMTAGVSAAQSGTLQAYYTDVKMEVDGKLEESGWLLNQTIGNAPAALLCDSDGLYVGVRTEALTAELTINGVAVTANSDAGTVTVNGKTEGKAARNNAQGTMEFMVLYSAVGMTYDRAARVPFAISVGKDSFNGELLLADQKVLLAEDFNDITKLPGKPGQDTSEIYAVQGENGSVHYKSGTLTEAGGSMSYPTWKVDGIGLDLNRGFQLSLTADFNDLAIPDPANENRFPLTGFAIDIRGNSQSRYGFHADEAGNIYVSMYVLGKETTKKVDTGLDLPAKNAKVFIDVNDDFESKVYINGKLVGTFPKSGRTPTAGNFNLCATTVYRGSDSRKTDVEVYDYFVTQAAPNLPLAADKLPRVGILTQDGTLSEGVWNLATVVGDSRFGVLCDDQYLYFGLESKQSELTFTLGQHKLTCKLGKNPSAAVGYTMGTTIKGNGKGQYEVAVPLNLLNIESISRQKLNMIATAGNAQRQFELVLGEKELVLVEYAPAAGDGKQDAIAYLNTDTLTLDGQLKENQWYNNLTAAGSAGAPAAGVGLLWDASYLYVGGQVYSANQAKGLTLTLNGKTFTANPSTGTTSAGNFVAAGQTFEWRIAMEDAGIATGMDVQVPYEMKIEGVGGASKMYGTATLAAQTMVFGDTCRDVSAREYTNITAASVVHTKWAQDDGFYNTKTDAAALGAKNEIYQHFTSLLNYAGGGGYEFTIDVTLNDLPHNVNTLGWRGLCFELREPTLQTRYNLRNDGKGNVLMDILYARDVVTMDTGIKLGERATITMKVSETLVPAMYVNGELVATFPTLDRARFTINDNYHMPRMIMQVVNHDRAKNEDGTLGAVNAYIHDIRMVKNVYTDVQGMLEDTALTLTEDRVLGAENPENVGKLNLPRELIGKSLTCSVDWKAIDRSTGEVANYVNLDTGVVTHGSKPVVFDLIATIRYEDASLTKTFTFAAQGIQAQSNVGLIVKDTNPLTGQVTDWTVNKYLYFDTTRNSIVFDQGASRQFNTIKLYDLDEVSRFSQQHLGVFVSDDGVTYTKVNGWLLQQNGCEYTIYNLSAKARYVKVHTYHDDLEREGEQPGFYNSLQDMITVSNNEFLPGANGAFAHSAQYAVADSGKDVPVFVSLSALGAKAGQYKNGAADFRFTVGNTTLAHWYNGSDGFYVRVPEAPATITAHWGCASAEDFSNAENVFEVSYGNVALIDFTLDSDLSSHGRPFTLSNGDIIVVARRFVNGKEDGSLAMVRSTDGGRTFDKKSTLVAKNISGAALGFGGYLYDEEIDRLYVFGYIGFSADSNDYRLFYTYTDDCGYTWSDWVALTNPAKEPIKDTDIIVPNMKEDIHRAILYCDGIKLREADGAGPNVDYVIAYNDTAQKTKFNVMTCVYSKDGGKTWLASDNELMMPINASKEIEDGVTEHSLIQLSDGRLHVLCRAQQDGNYYFYEGFSSDGGITWTGDYSKVISANTSPVAVEYNGDRLLMWSSYNSMGQKSYRRAPMHIAYTEDDFRSFGKVIDLTFGTSYDGLHEKYYHFTQPGICFTEDGKDALVAYWDASTYRRSDLDIRATVGFLVEDFDQMLYNNKGAYEDFETSSLKYEGWLRHLTDQFALSSEESASGLWSMKLNGTEPVYATRQLPSMKAGTVGAKVKVPSGNANDFYMYLKAGYNFDGLRHSLAAVAFSPDGTISAAYPDGNVALAKVTPGSWVDVAISFDIAANTGALYVDGNKVGDIALNTSAPLLDEMVEDVIQEITCVQFAQPLLANGQTSFLYVDDFYANELTTALKRNSDAGFADVKRGEWYYEAVNFAVENGIMSGYNATKFGPNDTLNRAMVVQVLYNKEGQPALNGLTHSFSDVPATQWFNNAVTWGSNRGVVSGFGGGVFKPEDAVTIEQVAVILRNYSGTPNGNGDLSGVGSYSDWAADALKWAVEKGILKNVPFSNATEKATRAQTAQMLTNYLRNI